MSHASGKADLIEPEIPGLCSEWIRVKKVEAKDRPLG